LAKPVGLTLRQAAAPFMAAARTLGADAKAHHWLNSVSALVAATDADRTLRHTCEALNAASPGQQFLPGSAARLCIRRCPVVAAAPLQTPATGLSSNGAYRIMGLAAGQQTFRFGYQQNPGYSAGPIAVQPGAVTVCNLAFSSPSESAATCTSATASPSASASADA
jgi:hypothetical protein